MTKQTKKKFEIQIPTEIVRSNTFSASEFILLTKLIQSYYLPKEKSLTLKIDHKALMFYLFIKDQKTLNKSLKSLHEKGIIENYTSPLPRKGALEIKLNEKVIPQLKSKKGYFTQMPSNVLDRNVIEVVGDVGVRLLYYYKSYINAKDLLKQFCFVSEDKTADDLGVTRKTVIKYNKILEKRKFIKIVKHKTENEINYNDLYTFERYNNHYYIRLDKINEFCKKSSVLLA